MTTLPGYIDVVQAATIVGCHPNTVNRWCQEGTLDAVKVGRKYVVKRSDLDALLEKGVHQDKRQPTAVAVSDSLRQRARARVVETYVECGIPAERAEQYLSELIGE